MYIYKKLIAGLVGFILVALWHPLMADVKFEDNFESGDLSVAMNGFKWENDVRAVVVSDGPKHRSGSSGRSLRFTFQAASAGSDSWSEQRLRFGQDMTDVFTEFYIFYPNGRDGYGEKYYHRNDEGPDNNKFFRVWDDDYRFYHVKSGFSTLPRQSSLISAIIPEHGVNRRGVGRFGHPYSSTHGIGADELGRWIRINMRISVDKGNGGVMQLWRDGKLLINNTVSSAPSSGSRNFFRNAYLLGWANSGFAKKTYIYIDDFKISDKPFGNGFDVKARPNSPDFIEVTPISN